MKNKFIKCLSVACLIVFSMFSFLLNFSFTPKAAAIKIEEQKQLKIIMEKEKPIIEALACWNTTTKTAEIKSKANFNEIRNAVNSGTTFSGYTITLNTDIDFDGEAFVPVGSMVGSTTRYFSGIFNGNGHSLKNIKITSNTTNICGDIGVFGYVSGGTIKNLTVVIDTLTITTADKSIGGIIGSSSGQVKVENCIVIPASSNSTICTSNTSADVSITVGGVVGYCGGRLTVLKCANFVPLSNTVYGTVRCGGIVGCFAERSEPGVNTCYSAGDITAGCTSTATTYVGGIAGSSAAGRELSIINCSNNAKITAKAKNTATPGGGTDTKTLRDTFGVKVQGAKNVTWDNYVYSIYAGGIIGDGDSGNVKYCVNNRTDHSVSSSTYYDYIKYFYGYQGETTTGVPCTEAWYGDFFDITFSQTVRNIREIGFNVTATNCYSSNFSNYYSTSTSATMYDRLYRVKITGANKNGVTGTPLTLEECVSDPDTSLKYIRETSISDSPKVTVPIGRSGNTILVGTFNSNRCDDTYFYSDYNGCWLKGSVYNLNTTTISGHQLGLSTVYVSNYNSLAQFYGVYNGSWINSSGYIVGDPFYAYYLSSGEQPHYQNLDSRPISLNTAYSSYFNSRFVTSSNDDCPSKYYEKQQKGYAIYNTKISMSEANGSYNFTHDYGYSYDRELVNEGTFWKPNNVWHMKHTTGSWALCSATSRKIDNTRVNTVPTSSTITTLQGSSTEWVKKDSLYTFKWLYWSENVSPVK